MTPNTESLVSEVPVYKVGETVTHKLGFKAVVHIVQKEMRSKDGAIVQDFEPADYVYYIGYLDKNGKVELLQVNHPVLDRYVG